MKTKAQKLLKTKKASSLQELKQKYFSTVKDSARKMLLILIQKQDPKFKG